MNMLIVNADQTAAIEALNASGEPDRQLRPVPLLDCRFALNADLLLDCGKGQTWQHYADLLAVLPSEMVSSFPLASI
jgi:hypothetical protein